MTRPFRFGLQISGQSDEIIEQAQAAEDSGFDIVTMADHIGPGLAPLPSLAAIAYATTDIRLGTFVVNAEFRNPVQLAWDSVTLDRLSNGRFELGLGAGHTPNEFSAIGVEKVSGRLRKERLAETVEIIHQLHAGDTVTWQSDFFDLVDATIDGAVQARLPVLVGGNGDRLLRHAGAHADIIGLQGLGKTLEDGHRHDVNFSVEHLEQQLAAVAAGANDGQKRMPELNALVQATTVSDDASVIAKTRAGLIDRVANLDEHQIDAAPYLMVGSVEQLVEKIHACRDRWGISYFVVRDRETFAPIVARLRGQ